MKSLSASLSKFLVFILKEVQGPRFCSLYQYKHFCVIQIMSSNTQIYQTNLIGGLYKSTKGCKNLLKIIYFLLAYVKL